MSALPDGRLTGPCLLIYRSRLPCVSLHTASGSPRHSAYRSFTGMPDSGESTDHTQTIKSGLPYHIPYHFRALKRPCPAVSNHVQPCPTMCPATNGCADDKLADAGLSAQSRAAHVTAACTCPSSMYGRPDPPPYRPHALPLSEKINPEGNDLLEVRGVACE